MIGQRCDGCRFWLLDPKADPIGNDPGWAWGRCRRNPPTLVSSMVAPQLPALSYGHQEELELDTIHAATASIFPGTHSSDWCGSYELAAACNQSAWDAAEKRIADLEAEMAALPAGTPDEVGNRLSLKLADAQRHLCRLGPATVKQALRRIEVALYDGPLDGVDGNEMIDEAKGLVA